MIARYARRGRDTIAVRIDERHMRISVGPDTCTDVMFKNLYGKSQLAGQCNFEFAVSKFELGCEATGKQFANLLGRQVRR